LEGENGTKKNHENSQKHQNWPNRDKPGHQKQAKNRGGLGGPRAAKQGGGRLEGAKTGQKPGNPRKRRGTPRKCVFWQNQSTPRAGKVGFQENEVFWDQFPEKGRKRAKKGQKRDNPGAKNRGRSQFLSETGKTGHLGEAENHEKTGQKGTDLGRGGSQ